MIRGTAALIAAALAVALLPAAAAAAPAEVKPQSVEAYEGELRLRGGGFAAVQVYREPQTGDVTGSGQARFFGCIAVVDEYDPWFWPLDADEDCGRLRGVRYSFDLAMNEMSMTFRLPFRRWDSERERLVRSVARVTLHASGDGVVVPGEPTVRTNSWTSGYTAGLYAKAEQWAARRAVTQGHVVVPGVTRGRVRPARSRSAFGRGIAAETVVRVPAAP